MNASSSRCRFSQRISRVRDFISELLSRECILIWCEAILEIVIMMMRTCKEELQVFSFDRL